MSQLLDAPAPSQPKKRHKPRNPYTPSEWEKKKKALEEEKARKAELALEEEDEGGHRMNLRRRKSEYRMKSNMDRHSRKRK